MIEIDPAVVEAEIHGIGRECPRAAEEIRVVKLQGERTPTTGGTTGEHPRVAGVDRPKTRFQGRNQLLHDRVAVGPAIGRIHPI